MPQWNGCGGYLRVWDNPPKFYVMLLLTGYYYEHTTRARIEVHPFFSEVLQFKRLRHDLFNLEH